MTESHQQSSAGSCDAARYRRLRVLGCAPYGTKHLSKGEVMRFTNLDDCVDADIAWVPSRGEAKASEPQGVALMREALVSAQKIIERDFPNGQLAIDIRNALAAPSPARQLSEGDQ